MAFYDSFDIHGIENLELFAKQVVEGFIIGLHKSPFHGFSVEFAEHRLYNPGDSTKNIDWKVYARTDKLFTKRFEEETNLRCQLVIDNSSSMYFPSSDLGKYNKLQFSALASVALMNLFRKQRDAFGLTLFDQDISTHSRAKTTTAHYRLMLKYLEDVIFDLTKSKPTDIPSVLHSVAERIHRRSLVIIFSDMLAYKDDSDELFSALQHLRYNKHEVVIFNTLDELEIGFDFENRPYQFTDLETGQTIRLHVDEVKKYYTEQFTAFKENLRTNCLKNRIDLVEVNIRDGFNKVLESYLIRRKKMLR